MRKITGLVLAAVLFMLQSCIKVNPINGLSFNVNIPYSQQVTVPQVAGDTFGVALPTGGIAISFPPVGFATNSQQYISQYNTAADKIQEVDLDSFAMQILSPSNQNFDFLDSVQLYISAPSQPEVLVAYNYSIAKGKTTLNLNTITTVNLKNYFIQDTMYLRINTHANAIPATGTQLNTTTIFHMLANLLG
jgi:hypothetical protein